MEKLGLSHKEPECWCGIPDLDPDDPATFLRVVEAVNGKISLGKWRNLWGDIWLKPSIRDALYEAVMEAFGK